MVKACTNMPMEIDMRVIGRRINKLAMDSISLIMAVSMKANGLAVFRKDKAHLYTQILIPKT
jgi:hypothetical protein